MDTHDFLKSLPLHPLQEILIDDETHLEIKIHIFITEDFIMELLLHGYRVNVLEPKSLADELKMILLESYQRY